MFTSTNSFTNYNKICLPNSKKVAFCSLTKQMEKKVMAMPYKEALRMLDGYQQTHLVIGHFPKDILNIIKKENDTHEDIDRKIKKFNDALAYQAQKLTSYDHNILRIMADLNILNFMYRAIIHSSNKGKKDYIGFVPYPIAFTMYPVIMERLLNTPEFSKDMKDIGLIPQNGTAVFDFVGSGTYKNCFRLDFLDENKKKIVHSKAFMVGKMPNLGVDCNKILKLKIKDYIENSNYEDFEREMLSKLEKDTTISDEIKAIAKEEIKEFYDRKYKTVVIYGGAAVFEDFNDINGIFPEANAALTIRRHLGKDIKRSNMAEPYIYDLKNNFGLREFADKESTTTEIVYNFKEHGLKWIDEKTDNYSMDKNYFNKQKIIDYGCIFPENKDYYND